MESADVSASNFSIYKPTKISNMNLVYTSFSGMHYEPL
jgi:hypothetical protein